MARFRVYRIAPDNGLAVDLQNDLFDGLSTRVMAPLAPVQDVTKLVQRLNPRFEIDGMVFAMMTQFIATVPPGERKDLHHTFVIKLCDIPNYPQSLWVNGPVSPPLGG